MKIRLNNWTPKERKQVAMEPVSEHYAVIWATHPDGLVNQVNFQYHFEAINKVEELWNSDLTLSLLKIEHSAEYVN